LTNIGPDGLAEINPIVNVKKNEIYEQWNILKKYYPAHAMEVRIVQRKVKAYSGSQVHTGTSEVLDE
jgi:hypothetical protein